MDNKEDLKGCSAIVLGIFVTIYILEKLLTILYQSLWRE